MLIQDIIEEIIEKIPENRMPVTSILRKLTQTRDRLLRNLSASQAQSGVLNQSFDLLAGDGLTQLICPPDNVVEVAIRNSIYTNQTFNDDARDWRRIPLKHLNEHSVENGYKRNAEYQNDPYYYFVSGKIGVYPPPMYDTFYGIKIFFTPVMRPLTTDDLNYGTGFDPNFDMLLVYGVLKDILPDNNAFYNRYQELYEEYRSATSGYEHFIVKGRW